MGRLGRQDGVGGRHRPPPQQLHGAALQYLGDDGLRAVAPPRIGIEEEEDADGEAVFGFEGSVSFEAMLAGLFLEEALWQLARQAGAIAGEPADSTAVLDVLQGEERFLD